MKNKYIIILIIFSFFLVLSASDGSNRIIEFLKQKNLSNGLIVLLISTLPIFELRLGLPLALTVFHMDYPQAIFFSLLGNFLPIIPILLLFKGLYRIFENVKPIKSFFDWVVERTKKKSQSIKKIEFWGLAIFVGIPLPGTGAWTGSIAAVILNLDLKSSILAITLGIILAAIIVSILVFLGKIGLTIFIMLIIVLYLLEIYRSLKNGK